MRKIILAGLICAVFVSGMFVGMMQIASAAQQDSPPNIASRLNAALNLIDQADKRLSSIQSVYVGPADPLITTTLQDIKAIANSLIARADSMLAVPP